MVLGVPLILSFQLSQVDPGGLLNQALLSFQHHPELQQDQEVQVDPGDRSDPLDQRLPANLFVQELRLCLVGHRILLDHQGPDHHEVH